MAGLSAARAGGGWRPGEGRGVRGCLPGRRRSGRGGLRRTPPRRRASAADLGSADHRRLFLDGTDYELRRYDADAPGLDNFIAIEYYPYDPALVLTGALRAYETTATVPWAYTREADQGHTKQVPGLLGLTIGDTEVELLAFADNGVLVLTFADSTTGAESYAPGRFLKLDLPGADGVVEVDFNRTIIPPCGFSDFYSCPLPPRQNRLTVPIRAGEKSVSWTRPRH